MQFSSIILVALFAFGAKGDDICTSPDIEYAPHEDCTKYYICDNGNAIEQECNPNLYWNPALNTCDFPINVPECVGGTRPPVGTPVPTTAATTPPPTTTQGTTTQGTTTQATTTQATTTLATTTTPTETPEPEPTSQSTTTRLPPGQCPPTGVVKIPHEFICEAYYTCVNGVRYEPYQMCPEGLQFDPVIAECNLESIVNCETVSTTTAATTTSAPGLPDCPETGVVKIPYPGNCTLYILCVEAVPIFYRCPEGRLFDTEQLECLPEAIAVCTVEGFEDIINKIHQNKLALVADTGFVARPRPIDGPFGKFFKRVFRV